MTAIVPVYDESPTAVEATVESLASQSEIPGEIIIVDDGSSVPPPAPPEPGRVMRLPVNLGISAARNRAAALSAGEFICFVNCDIVLDRDWIAKGLEMLRNEPRIGLVGGAISPLPPASRRSEWRTHFLEFSPTGQARDVEWIHGHALLVRRQAFADVSGFDETLRVAGEDVDFGRRLRAKGWRIHFDPKLHAILTERPLVSTLARKCLRHQGWWLGTGTPPRNLREVAIGTAVLGSLRSWKFYSTTNLRTRRPALLPLDFAVTVAQLAEIARAARRQDTLTSFHGIRKHSDTV